MEISISSFIRCEEHRQIAWTVDHLVKKCSSFSQFNIRNGVMSLLRFMYIFFSQGYAPTPQTTAARRSCWACPALLCVAVVWVGGWDGRSTTPDNRLL